MIFARARKTRRLNISSHSLRASLRFTDISLFNRRLSVKHDQFLHGGRLFVSSVHHISSAGTYLCLCTQVKKGRSNGALPPTSSANRAAVSMLIKRASTLLPGRGPHEVRSDGGMVGGGVAVQQRHMACQCVIRSCVSIRFSPRHICQTCRPKL